MGRKSHPKARLNGSGSRSTEQSSKPRATCSSSGEDLNRRKEIDEDIIDDAADSSTKLTDMTSSSEVDGAEMSVLPTWLTWAVFVWTLISRLWYVTTPTNWWILHPDEVYQTVEVAHTESFGYGLKPYEYLPPPGNVTYSSEHARTSRMGMYSLRSFMLVKVIAGVILAAERCGVQSSPFLIIKVFHAIVTSCLPLTVCRFSKALYKSREVATMSAIFTGFSLSLNVFGTHTLINSFISPLMFVSMVPFVRVLASVGKGDLVQIQKTDDYKQSNSSALKYACHSQNEAMRGSKDLINGKHAKANGHATGSNGDGHSNTHCVQNSHATNKHVSNGYAVNGHRKICPSLTNGYLEIKDNVKEQTRNKNMSETSPMFITYYKRWAHVIRLPSRLSQWGECTTKVNYALSGMLLGICIYTRPDTILIPSLICLFFIPGIVQNIFSIVSELSEYAIGIMSGIIFGGYVDHVTYGKWFISIKQWFDFNIWNGYSASVFGEQGSWFYIDAFTNLEPFALICTAVILLDITITIVFQLEGKSEGLRFNNKSSLVCFILLFIYSLIGHKEFRFFHNGIVLFYISVARSVYNLWHYYLYYPKCQNGHRLYCKVFYMGLTVFCSRHMCSFYYMDNGTVSQWTHGEIVDADVNICMDFLHRQTDVKGVFTDRTMFQFAGYSSFHKDIPLVLASLGDFMEYDKKITSKDVAFFSHTIQPGFSTFGRISDFFSARNEPYIVNIFTNKHIYNYQVIGVHRQFFEEGFNEVFRTETVKILTRSFLKQDEEKYPHIANRTPMSTNAAILEYEGNWLRYYGAYKRAEERLLVANRIDDKRIGPYQLLMEIFLLFNNVKNYNSVLTSCMAKHPAAECKKPYVSFKLDDIHQ